MSFWSKITENKGVALAVTALSLGGAVLWYYFSNKGPTSSTAKSKLELLKDMSRRRSLTRLKLLISTPN